MDKAWISGALGTPPTAPNSFSTGYPTDGNPTTSTPPTQPGAYWFHMVTMELLNVVIAAGITPSPTTLNQLKLAMDSLYGAGVAPVQSVNGRTGAVTGVVDVANFTGGNQSLSNVGYQKLPGGVLIQWGSVHLGDIAATTGTVTFPVAFPNAVLRVMTTMEEATSVTNTAGFVKSKSTTGFAFEVEEWVTGVQDCTLAWLSIGY